jgi:hypothetical protein
MRQQTISVLGSQEKAEQIVRYTNSAHDQIVSTLGLSANKLYVC